MTPQVKELIMMAEKSLEGEEGKERLRKNKVSTDLSGLGCQD